MKTAAQRRPSRPRPAPLLSAKSWLTEAPLRMLMNNLDPEVAERPEDLVVYGGIGKAARNREAYEAIVAALRELEADETLLVQSGKPVGVFRTHPEAPRVLIANSNLVPAWANWEHFRELDRKGLMMFGQMTAGSWIYIGSQGIVQGHLRDLRRDGAASTTAGDLSGRWILTADSAAWEARSRSPRRWPAPRCSRSSARPTGSNGGSRPDTSTPGRRRWTKPSR